MPLDDLDRLIKHAVKKLSDARSQWQIVRGPAAATVATAWRLNWTVHNASQITTDEGRLRTLGLDPPVVVKRECVNAVRRWRGRAIFAKFPHLGCFDASHGLFVALLACGAWK